MIRPVTGVTDKHVSISFGRTANRTGFTRYVLHGTGAPELHEF
jgi:hypothetical protein